MLPHRAYYELGPFWAEHRIRKADGEDLIGTDTGARLSPIHDVKKIVALFVPEQAIEAPFCERSHTAVMFPTGFLTELLCEIFHDAQRVVPQGLNFDRLPV